jgi:uncharacterized iron-regulated membrane protein
MALHKVILTIHLCLGLLGAIFLLILGLTGSVMAFEGDIDHWLNPGHWYVTPRPPAMLEDDLLSIVQHQYPRARVVLVQFSRYSNLAQVMQLTDGSTVYVNPYDGTILGTKVGLTNLDRTLGFIHQLHLRLVPDPRSAPRLAAIGKTVVSFAGLIVFLMVPTGVTLWWRRKSTSINWKASWFKVCFDAHQAVGIYVAFFLLVASLTGIMIGFDFGEKTFYGITGSAPPARPQPFPSVPVPGAVGLLPDQALEIARHAMPDATPTMLVRPMRAAGSYTITMRLPEETSEAVHSSVTLDQFSGKVLNVRNYRTESAGYRWIRFNRSINTGDIFGLPSHILLSLSSLLLVGMVGTGLVIWWKKLAV